MFFNIAQLFVYYILVIYLSFGITNEYNKERITENSIGVSISCTGSIDVVCAEGEFPEGSTWKAFGDKAVIEMD